MQKIVPRTGFFDPKLASLDNIHFTNLSSGLNEDFITDHKISVEYCNNCIQIAECMDCWRFFAHL